MKKFTLLAKVGMLTFVMSLITLTGISQTHFTPAVNNGAGNWHFYPVHATLDGVALVISDEIAIYDGSVCVGAHVLNDTLDGSYGVTVGNDWIAYEMASGDPGYTGGNSYIFKCWDASASTEYTGTMTYNTTFSPQDYIGTVFPATMTFRWSWIDLAFTTTVIAGDLSGNITESVSGDDISGVSVTATGTATYVTTTDADGDYLFDNIDVDTYTVSTSHASYVDASQAGVAVTNGNTTTQNFVLTYKTGTLSGFVYDQASAVVNGATVTLSGGGLTDDSDITGAYSIGSIAPGTYTATVTEPGYSNTVVTGIVIGADSTTSQNFTINSAGTLSGTVTDGTNGGTEDGVLVTVVETSDTYTTAGGGLFSFTLSPGTYSLTYAKSGFHTGSSTGLVVTAGNTTNGDETIYEPHYSMNDGNPYDDVWTIYLNTVTGDGGQLKIGDEVGIYTAQNTGSITTIARSKGADSKTITTASGGAAININSVGHGLSDNDEIEIYNSTVAGYNGTNLAITKVDADNFTVATSFTINTTADWQDEKITVTSTGHNLQSGDAIVLTGTPLGAYNGTYTNITNIAANTFDLDIPLDRTNANNAGTWTDDADLVGYFALTAPINGAGTAYALKAYGDIYNGFGYNDTDDFTFKLWLGGGSAESSLASSPTWISGTGLLVPGGTTFPTDATSPFSKVTLDFDVPDGTFTPTFTKTGGGIDSDIELYLKKSDGTTLSPPDTVTIAAGNNTTAAFAANVPAGTYSMVVSGDRFQSTTYTGIMVNSGVTTAATYVINYNTAVAQTVSLTTGYNLASRRVGTDGPDMTVFLTAASTDVTTSSKIDFVKDDDGVIDYYAGTVFDVGLFWNIKEGYQWKMNANESIVIPSATPLSYNADITIKGTSFTMISYLPSYNLDASTAFASLKTSDLDYIRDTDGNSLTKIAGSWVDHIGTCTPGEAFIVKWTGAQTTFNYPASVKSADAIEELEPVHFPFYSGYGNPANAIYTMYVSGSILEYGDEIAAFDGSTLVGVKVIQSNDEFGNNLVAFTELFDKPGYTAGNKIILKLWKATEDKEYWINFTNTNSDNGQYSYVGNTYPSGDAMYSQVDLALSPTGILDNLAEYINVYPNPSNGIVNISSPEQIDRLIVVNIVGQTVLDIQPESGNTKLNLDGFNPGVYFVNLVIDGQRVTKKLTIQ